MNPSTDPAVTYEKKKAALMKARAVLAARRKAANATNGATAKSARRGKAATKPARKPYAPRKTQRPSLDALVATMIAEASRLEDRARNLREAAVLLGED